MGRSLSLAAYRAFAKRTKTTEYTPTAMRPSGRVVWAHTTTAVQALAFCDVAERVEHLHPDCHLLITRSATSTFDLPEPAAGSHWLAETLPQDHPDSAQRFISHWQPDVLIWANGPLKPNLLMSAFDAAGKAHLVDVDETAFETRNSMWLPEVNSQLAKSFASVSGTSKKAASSLMRLGIAKDSLREVPALHACGSVPAYRESDLNELNIALSARPVWLAASITLSELETVLDAHRQCARKSHRLILIATPASTEDPKAFAKALKTSGLRLCTWGDGAMPQESHQVLFVESDEELGLWYRLSPVAFLGRSLGKDGGINPMIAAALGCAIIYGPHVGRYLETYSKLASVGAARMVKDRETLNAAVSRLSAPDRAAEMALSAWGVVAEAAESIDYIVDLIDTALSERSNA